MLQRKQVNGISPGSGAGVLVFQPGGVASANVYVDWPSLYAASVMGQTVLCSDAFAAVLIPAGSWPNVVCFESFSSKPNVDLGGVTIQLMDGCLLPNLQEQGDNVRVVALTATTTPITVPPGGWYRLGVGASIGVGPSVGSVPPAIVFQVSSNAGSLYLSVNARVGTGAGDVGIEPLSPDASSPVVIVADGGALASSSVVGVGSFAAGASCLVQYTNPLSFGSFAMTQPGVNRLVLKNDTDTETAQFCASSGSPIGAAGSFAIPAFNNASTVSPDGAGLISALMAEEGLKTSFSLVATGDGSASGVTGTAQLWQVPQNGTAAFPVANAETLPFALDGGPVATSVNGFAAWHSPGDGFYLVVTTSAAIGATSNYQGILS